MWVLQVSQFQGCEHRKGEPASSLLSSGSRDEGEMPSSSSSPSMADRELTSGSWEWETCPHPLHLGEQAPPTAWAAGESWSWFWGLWGRVLVSWSRGHKSRKSSKLMSSDTFNWPTSASTPSMNCWSAGPKDPILEDLHSIGQERIYKKSSFESPVLIE